MTFKKNLISLKAFLSTKNIVIIDIICFCNLKSTDSWRIWTDDFENELKITDDKDFIIKLNNNHNYQIINSKDLYIKSHIKNIAKNSKLCLIGISDELYYIWLLDNSNILRLYSYVNDIFIGTQPPVLLSSIDTLKKIIRNINVEKYQEIFHITEPTSRREFNKVWITKLPMDEQLITLLPEIIKKDLNFNV